MCVCGEGGVSVCVSVCDHSLKDASLASQTLSVPQHQLLSVSAVCCLLKAIGKGLACETSRTHPSKVTTLIHVTCNKTLLTST